MGENEAIDRAKEPDLHAESEYLIYRHLADPRLQKLPDAPMELEHIDDVAVETHDGAHDQHGEAGADAVVEDCIVGTVIRFTCSSRSLTFPPRAGREQKIREPCNAPHVSLNVRMKLTLVSLPK